MAGFVADSVAWQGRAGFIADSVAWHGMRGIKYGDEHGMAGAYFAYFALPNTYVYHYPSCHAAGTIVEVRIRVRLGEQSATLQR